MYLHEGEDIHRYSLEGYRQSYALEPSGYQVRPDWMVALGRISMRQGDFQTALMYFTTVLERIGDNRAIQNAVVYCNLALEKERNRELLEYEREKTLLEAERHRRYLELVRSRRHVDLDAYIWLYALVLAITMALAWHSAWLYGGFSQERFAEAYEASPLPWVVVISLMLYGCVLLSVRLFGRIVDCRLGIPTQRGQRPGWKRRLARRMRRAHRGRSGSAGQRPPPSRRRRGTKGGGRKENPRARGRRSRSSPGDDSEVPVF